MISHAQYTIFILVVGLVVGFLILSIKGIEIEKASKTRLWIQGPSLIATIVLFGLGYWEWGLLTLAIFIASLIKLDVVGK